MRHPPPGDRFPRAAVLAFATVSLAFAGCGGAETSRGVKWVSLPELLRATRMKAIFDEDSPRVVLDAPGMRVSLAPGFEYALVNGQPVVLDAPPRYRAGTLEVPESFLQTLRAKKAAVAKPTLPKTPSGTPLDWRVPAGTSPREWRHIVIHHSGTPTGSAGEFDVAHKARGWDGLGYDFVIGNGLRRRGDEQTDGDVAVGQRWLLQKQGAHAGVYEYNQHGIGICLVGNFNATAPTAKQMASLRQLIRFLMQEHQISGSHIYGHKDIKQTDCPGRNFPLAAIKREFR